MLPSNKTSFHGNQFKILIFLKHQFLPFLFCLVPPIYSHKKRKRTSRFQFSLHEISDGPPLKGKINAHLFSDSRTTNMGCRLLARTPPPSPPRLDAAAVPTPLALRRRPCSKASVLAIGRLPQRHSLPPITVVALTTLRWLCRTNAADFFLNGRPRAVEQAWFASYNFRPKSSIIH